VLLKLVIPILSLVLNQIFRRRPGQPELMFQTIQRNSMKTSLWKTLKSFMGDDIALTMDFYRWQSNQYSDSPQATYRIDLMALQAIVQHDRSLRTL
jgi:hypothetical protein